MAVVHRNPLFSVPGVTVLSLLIDILHAAYLGPVQSWEVRVLWLLIDRDVFNAGKDELTLIRLRHEMNIYDWRTRAEQHTRIQMLTSKMLGSRSDPARQPFNGG